MKRWREWKKEGKEEEEHDLNISRIRESTLDQVSDGPPDGATMGALAYCQNDHFTCFARGILAPYKASAQAE